MWLTSTYIFLLGIFLISCTGSNEKCRYSYYGFENNLAFNNGDFYYPSSLESSESVDRKLLKLFILDGVRYNEEEDYRYIQFTGGPTDIIDTCGWRHATIDFGQPLNFNRTLLWFLKDSLQIDNYRIQHWHEMLNEWETLVFRAGENIRINGYESTRCPLVFIQDTFPIVKSSKIRFLINNCQSYFYLTEFEVYLD